MRAVELSSKRRAGARFALIGIALFWLCPTAHGESDFASQLLSQTLNEIESDPSARERTLERGKERSRFCSYCHGKDGAESKDNIPRLAGQNPFYLLKQFDNFEHLRRRKTVMEALAKSFSEEEKVILAVYFATLPSPEPDQDLEPPADGEALFQQRCVSCHSADQEPTAGMPRLAGQNPAYLARSLARFKAKDPSWQAPVMWEIAGSLSDDEIELLSQYLTALPAEPPAATQAPN